MTGALGSRLARRGPAWPIGLAGLLGLALVSAALARRGAPPTLGLLLLAGGAAAIVLLNDARAALLVSISAFVLAESAADWGISAPSRLYEGTPFFFTPAELLLLLATAAVVLDLVRRDEPMRLPAPFTVPLLLAAAAALYGILNGRLGGGAQTYGIVTFFQTAGPLFLYPLLVVNVVRTPRDLRRALGAAGLLAVAKALLGLFVLLAGFAQTTAADGPALTYYEPTANFLLMLALLVMAGAKLSGAKVPRWFLWSAPLVFAALLLSYRRTFWIATALCLLLVAVAASGRVGRRLAVPLAVLVVGVGWLVAQSGVVGDLQGPVVQRAESINPSKVKRNEQDRYRLAERRNVMAEIREHPFSGIGIGVDWAARYPLTFAYQDSRQYVHFAALWWWLKMGLLGLAAYVLLLGTAVATGLRVARRHADPVVRVAGLAAGIGCIGFAVIELAATVLGPDQRGTAAFGVLLGLLAVADLQGRSAPTTTLRGG